MVFNNKGVEQKEFDEDEYPWINKRNVLTEKMDFFHFARYDILLKGMDMYAVNTLGGNNKCLMQWKAHLEVTYMNIRSLLTDNLVPAREELDKLFAEVKVRIKRLQVPGNTKEQLIFLNHVFEELVELLKTIQFKLCENIQAAGLGVNRMVYGDQVEASEEDEWTEDDEKKLRSQAGVSENVEKEPELPGSSMWTNWFG